MIGRGQHGFAIAQCNSADQQLSNLFGILDVLIGLGGILCKINTLKDELAIIRTGVTGKKFQYISPAPNSPLKFATLGSNPDSTMIFNTSGEVP